MTRRKAEPETPTRCQAVEDELQCLFEPHDEQVPHAFTEEQAAEIAGGEGLAGDDDTETAGTPPDGAGGPPRGESGTEIPSSGSGDTPPGVAPARESANSWWCGRCDTSMPFRDGNTGQAVTRCAKCGTPRT
jgi:hypothetical protein